MNRARRARQIVDLVHFDKQRHGHVVTHHLEPGIVQQVGDIGASPREEIVDAEHFRARVQKTLAKEGANETGTAGHENSGNIMHTPAIPAFPCPVKALGQLKQLGQCAWQEAP